MIEQVSKLFPVVVVVVIFIIKLVCAGHQMIEQVSKLFPQLRDKILYTEIGRVFLTENFYYIFFGIIITLYVVGIYGIP